MHHKNKRMLWLLNHVTLMKTEIPILLAMGCEVFTPKRIPNDPSFRSGAVDFSYDKDLTIPPQILATLNEDKRRTCGVRVRVIRSADQVFDFLLPHTNPNFRKFAVLRRRTDNFTVDFSGMDFLDAAAIGG
ncbi:hypothetical protein ACLKMY_23685 [Paraburkholderia mimosarum]|uniref:hypothetical protein n=1 Tax=Paraburkholderia mimosarum TaxID=312026 RepID=UPI0039C2C25A